MVCRYLLQRLREGTALQDFTATRQLPFHLLVSTPTVQDEYTLF